MHVHTYIHTFTLGRSHAAYVPGKAKTRSGCSCRGRKGLRPRSEIGGEDCAKAGRGGKEDGAGPSTTIAYACLCTHLYTCAPTQSIHTYMARLCDAPYIDMHAGCKVTSISGLCEIIQEGLQGEPPLRQGLHTYVCQRGSPDHLYMCVHTVNKHVYM